MSRHPKDPDQLNDQQERFCQEYLKDLNGTQAAIRAGYAKKSAAVEASRLLRNAKVQQRCQDLMNARSERVQIDADTILLELLKLARSDLRKLFGPDGSLLSVDQWPDEAAIAIQSVEVDEIWEGRGDERTHIGYTKKVRFWDKPKALELLGKHLKLFVERHEHSGTIKLEDLVAGAEGGSEEKKP